ncbi:hypothetical protein G6738_004820 [Escherichia coli]|nr:hypothetical protein [Escherichia coli]EFJ2983169.1 hypothetical protein [Escherichia coli]EFK4235136.1 hypothetical protein [Escherichia coli]
MTSNNNAAYLRGRRIAMRWKRIKTVFCQIDMFCINVARKYHLPGWAGRIPVMLLLTTATICGIFSLFAALCCFFLIAAPFCLMAMMKNLPEVKIGKTKSNLALPDDFYRAEGFTIGPQGLGYYINGHRLDDDQ